MYEYVISFGTLQYLSDMSLRYYIFIAIAAQYLAIY
jgi:hypothetical protein